MLKLVVGIKVVFDCLFAASCHQYDFSDARRDRFLDHVFDNGTVSRGSNSFGIALVAGSIRVPRPATGMTAFLIGLIMVSPRAMSRFFCCRYLISQGLNFRLKLNVLTLFAG